jgi:hypothetical protein
MSRKSLHFKPLFSPLQTANPSTFSRKSLHHHIPVTRAAPGLQRYPKWFKNLKKFKNYLKKRPSPVDNPF